jgi:4-hydroxybenzoate polyprenyltransferase
MKFFRFLRFSNLLIVAVSQYLIRYCLIKPALLDGNSVNYWQNDELSFGLFVGMTVFAATGGYIINDIIDESIDAVNKPEKQFIGVYFDRKNAYKLYGLFIIIGLLCAISLCFYSGHNDWIFYYTSASMLLFAYSKWLKKRVLIGNIVVAIFTACVAWGLILPLITTPIAATAAYKIRVEILVLYCLFAFLSNLWREIIKDIEDIEGDALHACQTMPIKWGIKFAKNTAFSAGISLLLLVIFFITELLNFYQNQQYNTLPSIIWLIVCVILPLLYTLFIQYKAKEKADYNLISSIIKGLMLGGLISLAVFWFFCP